MNEPSCFYKRVNNMVETCLIYEDGLCILTTYFVSTKFTPYYEHGNCHWSNERNIFTDQKVISTKVSRL